MPRWILAPAMAAAACAGPGGPPPPATPPAFAVAVLRADDAVTVAPRGGDAVVRVRSPGGIGGADLAPVSGAWPARIVFELELAGLEGFSVAAPAADGRAPNLAEGLRPRKIGDRLFAVVLPARRIPPGTRTLRVSWIDFYR